MARYWILVGRATDSGTNPRATFEILFGSFDRSDVASELVDYRDHPGNAAVWSDLRLLSACDAAQDVVDAVVAGLNAKHKQEAGQ